jgi:SAM-dependent methyltransferase
LKSLEKQSLFYDKNIVDMEKSEHRYEDLYLSACNMLINNNVSLDETIIDMGCGIGSFAKHLRDFGFQKYVGIDFSERAITRAKERFPNYRFVFGNLVTDKISRKIIKKGNVFVCFEVLEHIENDKEIIKGIPENSLFIFSVPNISGHGHVRWFENQNKVEERYSDVVQFTEEKTQMIKKGKPHHKLFLFKTYVKERKNEKSTIEQIMD